jgi:hypothetical protein
VPHSHDLEARLVANEFGQQIRDQPMVFDDGDTGVGFWVVRISHGSGPGAFNKLEPVLL